MRYQVKATPNSKESSISEENGILLVKVGEPPIAGRVNRRLIEILAEYFKTSQVNIRIVAGFSSRNKIIEVK